MLRTIENGRRRQQLAREYLLWAEPRASGQREKEFLREYANQHALRVYDDVETVLRISPNCTSIVNVGGFPYLFEFFLLQKYSGLVRTFDLEPERYAAYLEDLDVEVLSMDIESGDPPDLGENYDVVVFCEVLEHLRINVLRTVRMLATLLKPEGLLYLTTPNGAGFVQTLKCLLTQRTGPPPVREWGSLDLVGFMGHVREYSPVECEEMLRACGFSEIDLTFRNMFEPRRFSSFPLLWTRTLVSRLWHQKADMITITARRSRQMQRTIVREEQAVHGD
jgi:SAM-dependent methyltransferase